VTPPTITIPMGLNKTVNLTCTVVGNPLPVVNWTSSDSLLISQPEQPVTRFQEPITSVLTLDLSAIPAGRYVVSCLSTLELPSPAMNSSDVVVTVFAELRNLTIQATPPSVVLGAGPDLIVVTCTVESRFNSGTPPSFNFSWRGDQALPSGEVVFIGDDLYQSNTTVNVSELNVGTETVNCTSFLSLPDAHPPQTTKVDVEVTAVFENISISSSSDSVILGSGSTDMVTINCSVLSAVPPQFFFFLDGELLDDPSNATNDGSSLLYFSSRTLSMTELNSVGAKNVSCQAMLLNYALSASLTIVVDSIFKNVSLVDNVVGGNFVLSDPLDRSLVLNCSVESSQVPVFDWTRNGGPINGSMPMPVGEGRYESVLVIAESELVTLQEEFECNAIVNVSGRGLLMSSASTVVMVDVILTNITVEPSESGVNFTLASIGGQEGVVNLTCRLAASLEPEISWTRVDGQGGGEVEVQGTNATVNSSMSFQSQLQVNASEFRGQVTFTCTASVQGRQFNGSINASASVVTQGKRKCHSNSSIIL